MACDHSTSSAPHLTRNAEQVRNHRDRNGLRELGDEIGRAVQREGVDPRMRQAFDLRLELFDPPRDEGAVDEVAQPRVREAARAPASNGARARRTAQDAVSNRAEPPSADRPAEAPVAQQRRDIGEAREAPEAVILPEERRRGLADRCVGGIGIVEEIGVARVEAHAPPRDVDGRSHGPVLSPTDRRPQRHRARRPSRRGPNRARSARRRTTAR